MLQPSRASALVVFTLLAACNPPAGCAGAGPERSSSGAQSAPQPPGLPAPPTLPTPPPTGTTGPAGAEGAACRGPGECAGGRSCVYEEASCTAAGHCRASGVPSHGCYIAVAMCACRDRHTFYGLGGCAGAAGEPWELYACPCTRDGDCGAGQRCVPTGARPHAPGAVSECRPPNDVR